MLKWEVMKNMVRPKSAISKTYAPFIVSAPKNVQRTNRFLGKKNDSLC